MVFKNEKSPQEWAFIDRLNSFSLVGVVENESTS